MQRTYDGFLRSILRSFDIMPYVMEKVKKDHNILKARPRHVGLLENVFCVLGPSINDFNTGADTSCYHVSPKERIALIKDLLEAGANPGDREELLPSITGLS